MRLIAAAVLFTGIFLRIWQWPAQILLDDEWHALNFVSNRSLFEVFLQQGLGANSIPVNVYTWLLLHTVGWSEPLLRLPSLLAGCFTVIVIPLLAKRLWGSSVGLVAAALTATSPVLIFYSRVARPYGPVMLFASASVLLTICWLREGRRRDLALSATCGFIAVYYHLYAAIPVVMPLLVATVASVNAPARLLGFSVASARPFRDLLPVGAVMAAATGFFIVLPNLLNPWWSGGIHGRDQATMDTLLTVLGHLAGTHLFLLKVLMALLALAGLALLLKRERTVGLALLLPLALFSIAMALSTQEGAHAGIQVSRYGIAFFPLLFVAIAVAVVRSGEALQSRYGFFRDKHVLVAAALVVWSPFLMTSPLWKTYAAANNFTNHSAYQYRYEPIAWRQRSPERDLIPGFSMAYADIPRFYLQSPLLAETKGIIEYPVLLGDQLNLYYYYQHFHRLPVVAGFVLNNAWAPVEHGSDFIVGNLTIDSILEGMPESIRKKTSWNAMVDLNDTNLLRSRYKGWAIVVHRDPPSEFFRNDFPDYPMSLELVDILTGEFGAPAEMDAQLAVWMIK